MKLPIGIATLALSTVAHAGVPGWCKGEEMGQGPVKDIYIERDYKDALVKLVAATCYPTTDATAQAAKIEAVRQSWSTRLDLVESDWADVAAWAHHSNVERNAPTVTPRSSQTALTAYSPFDQYAAILNANTGVAGPISDPSYLADALGGKLTEAGRLGYISTCLSPDGDDLGARWAMCEHDITAFDPKKLVGEIRGDTVHDGYQRMIVRLAAYRAVTVEIPAQRAAVKALRAKDPAYDKMFALAVDALARWSKVDQNLVALATQIDDARVTASRKASEGCEATTWNAFEKRVAGLGAKPFASARDRPESSFVQQAVAILQNEPDGYLAALALQQCAAAVGKSDYIARVIGAALNRWSGFRGPRTAAQTLITTAGLALDDKNATIAFPAVERPWLAGTIDRGNAATGTIAAIKDSTITFAKEKIHQVRCTRGHYTNRISQILNDGTIVYYYVCDAEVEETVAFAPSPPVKVNPRYAKGLRVGMTVAVVEDVVQVAYPKSSSKLPVVVAGVEVK